MKLNGTATITEQLPYAQIVVSPLFHVRESQNAGTPAVTTGTRYAILLNEVILNEISGATLDSVNGNVNLPAGEYYIKGIVSSWKCNRHRAEIRNKYPDVNTTYLKGPMIKCEATNSNVGNTAIVQGYINFASSVTITLYHNVETPGTNNPYNGATYSAAGSKEIYSNLLIWKLS